jgi:hypothetical protein
VASLYVTEYAQLVQQQGEAQMMAVAPPLAEQKIAIGGASTPSAAFNAATRCVRIHTDAICSIAFGTAPVAAATNARLGANATEYFGVQPGSKVAVITNT